MCALEAEDGFAQTEDGVRLYRRVSGKGPFVLVMPVNWGMDSYLYARGLSALEFHVALVTWDPRGVGRSDPARSPNEYDLVRTAEDARAVADDVGLDMCVVLGHSSGGAVALTYALAYPRRVSHLVLVSTAPRWETGSAPIPSDALPRTEEEMRAQVRASIPGSVRDPARFARAMDELLPRSRFSPDRLRRAAAVDERTYDVRSRLGEVRVPTLIVHGRDDAQVPFRHAEELLRGVPGSRLLAIDDCGHWPHVEKREAFVRGVTEFLGLGRPPLRAGHGGSPRHPGSGFP